MTTPYYLQQIVFSGVRRASVEAGRLLGLSGIFQRPSFTSLVLASLDLMTALAAGGVALLLRTAMPEFIQDVRTIQRTLPCPPLISIGYVCWYAVCLIFFSHSHGLYGLMQARSGLHELRMTLQASLVAGLLLCGALYLSRGLITSRQTVIVTVLLTAVLLCVRRGIWRRMVYARHRKGLETRNIVIVGAGRIAYALRDHLQGLGHLGFRFKGFVALTEREAESGDVDIVGNVANCITVARELFVDEIFVSVPADRTLVIRLVEEARVAGIDIRVVPEVYDGLASNAPVEYVGQFPTISLHRRNVPLNEFLLKKTFDVTLSMFALLVAFPLLLGIAIAVKLDYKGLTFYRVPKIGRKGRTFVWFKFRTKVSEAEKLKKNLGQMYEREGHPLSAEGPSQLF